MINKDLKEYIETYIFPSYEKNDEAHNLEHIKYVIDRSLKFASKIENINLDMVYVIASYHDIGHYIDAKNHEKVSSEMLLQDKNLSNWFSNSAIKIMADAVFDHRASNNSKPRSIYGKIVSSADRNTNVDDIIKRSFLYHSYHFPSSSVDEIIEGSRLHLIKKFGEQGYAKEKMYFQDEEYNSFLEEMCALTNNPCLFYKRCKEVNHIDEKNKI